MHICIYIYRCVCCSIHAIHIHIYTQYTIHFLVTIYSYIYKYICTVYIINRETPPHQGERREQETIQARIHPWKTTHHQASCNLAMTIGSFKCFSASEPVHPPKPNDEQPLNLVAACSRHSNGLAEGQKVVVFRGFFPGQIQQNPNRSGPSD